MRLKRSWFSCQSKTKCYNLSVQRKSYFYHFYPKHRNPDSQKTAKTNFFCFSSITKLLFPENLRLYLFHQGWNRKHSIFKCLFGGKIVRSWFLNKSFDSLNFPKDAFQIDVARFFKRLGLSFHKFNFLHPDLNQTLNLEKRVFKRKITDFPACNRDSVVQKLEEKSSIFCFFFNF